MSWILSLETMPIQYQIIIEMVNYQLGLEVRNTTSIEEAYKLALEGPALIITDMCLRIPPDRDFKTDKAGIIFCHNIKSNPATSHIPVIMRSNFRLYELDFTFADTKADSFIWKAGQLELLLSEIRRLLPPSVKTITR